MSGLRTEKFIYPEKVNELFPTLFSFKQLAFATLYFFLCELFKHKE